MSGNLDRQETKIHALSAGKLHNIMLRVQKTHRKSLEALTQETGVSKSSVRNKTPPLKLRPYKIAIIHAMQARDPVSRVQFCSRILLYIAEGEITLQLTFFSDEAWLHLQRFINTHNETLNPVARVR
jgi:hypothetical protein